jgi:hypothetical protein
MTGESGRSRPTRASLLAGHEKSWLNVRTNAVVRLEPGSGIDHDAYAIRNTAAMGFRTDGLDEFEVTQILNGRTRNAGVSWQLTLIAGAAGWVRVHQNLLTHELNIDALDGHMALAAARMVANTMADIRSLSLDLEKPIFGRQPWETCRHFVLDDGQPDAFIRSGRFDANGCRYSVAFHDPESRQQDPDTDAASRSPR